MGALLAVDVLTLNQTKNPDWFEWLKAAIPVAAVVATAFLSRALGRKSEHEKWLRDQQLVAYTELAAAARALVDAMTGFVVSYRLNIEFPDEVEMLLKRSIETRDESRRKFLRAYEAASLVASAQVELRSAALLATASELHHDMRPQPETTDQAALDDEIARLGLALREFVESAREDLGTSTPSHGTVRKVWRKVVRSR